MTTQPQEFVLNGPRKRVRCIHKFPVNVTGVGIVKPRAEIEVDEDLAKRLLDEGRFEIVAPKTKTTKEDK